MNQPHYGQPVTGKQRDEISSLQLKLDMAINTIGELTKRVEKLEKENKPKKAEPTSGAGIRTKKSASRTKKSETDTTG